jgi:quinol monooxygenase YgiN
MSSPSSRQSPATVRAEEGCIEYGPAIDVAGHRDPFGPDVFVVIEKWTSVEALAAHAASPHMAAYAGRMRELDLIASQAVHALEPC